jgi:hypothetical protein
MKRMKRMMLILMMMIRMMMLLMMMVIVVAVLTPIAGVLPELRSGDSGCPHPEASKSIKNDPAKASVRILISKP